MAITWQRFELYTNDPDLQHSEAREPEVAYRIHPKRHTTMKNTAINPQVNSQKAEAFGEFFFHLMNEDYQIPCSNAFLRMESEDEFRLVFLVQEQAYLSEDFTKVYERSMIERRKINNDQFHLSVLFLPEVATMDKTKIVKDGYLHYYNGKTKQ